MSLMVSARVSEPLRELGNSELDEGRRLVKAESHSRDDFRLKESWLLTFSPKVRELDIISKDFFRSAIVKELDLDAGLPFHGLGTIVFPLDFLQESKIFLRLIASIESFLRTLGLLFSSSFSEIVSVRILPDLGELGGLTLECDKELRPELTAESLSESSDLTAA